MNERIFHVMIRQLCNEMNIDFKKLSYDWVLQLSKDGKVRHITGTRFDINPEATGNIACDKYATFEVLNSQDVPIIKHVMIFNPAMRDSFIEEDGIFIKIASEFLKYQSLVVKPNYGCEGRGVSLCRTLKETESAIQKLFRTQSSITICPFYDIKKEYRTFYLDGEVCLIYGKEKPFVVGDGLSTVEELIEGLDLPDKKVVQENLKTIKLDYVPKKGEKFNISWKHNLSGGAKPEILKKGELYNNIEALAIKAGKAMNIKFATIDIIQTSDDSLYVMEVNSGIGATMFIELIDGGYEIIKDIYRKALTILFQ